jgi:hypothetical protein
MLVTHVNGRCVETCANIKLSFFLHVLISLKKNIIQYYGRWYGYDHGGFATMFANNESDDEEANEDHYKEPWVVDMCELMRTNDTSPNVEK